MSHFATAVILKDINDLEKVLAPFDENLEVPKYIKYTREQAIANKREEIERIKKNCYEKYLQDKDAYIRDYKSPHHIDFLENEFPCWLKWDDDKCWEEESNCYDDEMKDEQGNLYSTYNPKSKWDWWALCEKGAYARFVDEKMPKGYCKIKDFCKELDIEEYNKALRFWELVVEEKPLKEGEEKPFNFYKKEYYYERHGSKEEYAKIKATPHYFAFVLKGEWIEKGKMHMFGFSDDTKKSEAAYLEKWEEVINDPQYQDYYIAIVDCHI